MIKVAAALNSFASEPEATAPPSEEIFVLSAGQLEAIITQAIEHATALLAARLDALEERGVGCGEGGEDAGTWVSSPAGSPAGAPAGTQGGHDPIIQVVQLLQAEITALRSELEAFQDHVAQERAYDRQRIARLEHKEPQPLQKDRADILRALLAANNGKLLRSQARKKMHLSESRFSELLAMTGEYIEVQPYYRNNNQKLLVLK